MDNRLKASTQSTKFVRFEDFTVIYKDKQRVKK